MENYCFNAMLQRINHEDCLQVRGAVLAIDYFIVFASQIYFTLSPHQYCVVQHFSIRGILRTLCAP